ncbi:hypothetical protein CDAR_268241 [Caerostris darwini]|uniref:Uncharacterized protein n=1 Tax=Caerostris darwini TaxID=1538125 RepID=A0AAV4TN72_9ARAC|nr:hypothetical protein CDAR_268241 [Caerostris darwini]
MIIYGLESLSIEYEEEDGGFDSQRNIALDAIVFNNNDEIAAYHSDSRKERAPFQKRDGKHSVLRGHCSFAALRDDISFGISYCSRNNNVNNKRKKTEKRFCSGLARNKREKERWQPH